MAFCSIFFKTYNQRALILGFSHIGLVKTLARLQIPQPALWKMAGLKRDFGEPENETPQKTPDAALAKFKELILTRPDIGLSSAFSETF